MHRIWQILSNNILHDTRRTASFIAVICRNDKNDAITLHTPESGIRSMKFLHGKNKTKKCRNQIMISCFISNVKTLVKFIGEKFCVGLN